MDLYLIADVSGWSPTHVLIRAGISSVKADLITALDDFNSKASEKEIIAYFKGISKVAKKLGISLDTGKGYRTISNLGEHGGQEVPHLHFHLLGGEKIGRMLND